MTQNHSSNPANIHVRTSTKALHRLICEQIEATRLYRCDAQSPATLIITDTDMNDDMPTIKLARGQLRLGDMMDRLRYTLSGRAQKLAQGDDGIDLGYALFTPSENTIKYGDVLIRLTEKERAMLEMIITAGEKGVTRLDLLEKVWGYVAGTETHTLETHMYRLRQKLAECGAENCIEAQDGRYRFVPTTSTLA